MFKNPFRRKKKLRGNEYFSEITDITRNPARLSDIIEAVERRGFWEESFEWRISTVMDSRIDAIEKDSRNWFRVTVKCGHEFQCHTQTIERAAYFTALYRSIIMDMFYNLGWPSSSSDMIKVHNLIRW
jgi:hypothetical protein